MRAGGDGGLEPALPRALSAGTGGLVLAMEATRTRDRYVVGAFLSGRTVEHVSCIEGVVRGGAGRALCDEDVVTAMFGAWAEPVLGTEALGAAPHRVGGDASGGLLASPVAAPDGPETPLARVVVRGGA